MHLIFRVCAAAALLLWANAALPAKEIALYHTSDIHGYYFARPDTKGVPFGGFAALEGVLQNEQRPFLLLDSGDFSSGNREANASNGKYSVDLMNRAGKSRCNAKGAGYAALTIGNHDSDFGDERLGKTLSGFQGDILSANIEGFSVPGKEVKPFAIYETGEEKIAVIGFSLDGPGMRGMKLRRLTTADWEALLDRVMQEKPNAVILLAHDSAADARKPSSLLPVLQNTSARTRIHLFLGGHAHILNNGRQWGENGPLFVESGSMLEGVSRIVLDFDDKTRALRSVHAEYVPLSGQNARQDAATAALLDSIEDKTLRQPYAYVPALLPKYPAPGDAAPALARRVAQQMYLWTAEKEPVDFAMFQLPGIRRDLLPGPLTGRDMAELLPYTEYVSTFDITGKHLKQAMAASIRRDGKGDYSLFAYSENVKITYKYNAKNKKHPVKITSVRINGQKVKNKRIYRVAAIAHIPQGYFEGAPFKVSDGRQKIYEERTSGQVLFDYVSGLPGNTPQEKLLTAPQGIQIRKLN